MRERNVLLQDLKNVDFMTSGLIFLISRSILTFKSYNVFGNGLYSLYSLNIPIKSIQMS